VALIGVVPPFLLLWWFERLERRVREPLPEWRYRVLAAGALSTLPVGLLGRPLARVMAATSEPLHTLFDAFVVAAALEEGAKLACLLLLTRGALAPRTRYGAFLYAVHASMGFAIVENVIAFLRVPDLEVLTQRFILRAYLAVPLHLTTGGVLGAFWSLRRFDRARVGSLGGAALAVLIHGVFDALLLAVDRLPEEHETARTLSAAVAFMLPLLGVATLLWVAHVLRGRDHRDQLKLGPVGRRSSAGSVHAP
jgi:RsiW-degrading membrane proteinase PrsW (M82 family)